MCFWLILKVVGPWTRIKVQLITTSKGISVEFSIVAGSQADVKVLDQLPFCLPAGSVLYADLAYTNYHLEDMLADDRIKLYYQRKANAHQNERLLKC